MSEGEGFIRWKIRHTRMEIGRVSFKIGEAILVSCYDANKYNTTGPIMMNHSCERPGGER